MSFGHVDIHFGLQPSTHLYTFFHSINRKKKTGKMGYIQRADGRGFAVEGLVHQPLCGLPTDGFPVRSGPWVNISILILYSLSRSPSAYTHLFHSSKSRWYFLSVTYIEKKCFPQTLNVKNSPNGDSLNSQTKPHIAEMYTLQGFFSCISTQTIVIYNKCCN